MPQKVTTNKYLTLKKVENLITFYKKTKTINPF